jgi:hypothetical protein
MVENDSVASRVGNQRKDLVEQKKDVSGQPLAAKALEI